MKVESAINLQGMVVTVGTTTDEIMFKKADQFAAEMANRTKVIADDGVRAITLAESRRAWMHRKLDAWIDGVEE
jgi:Mg-chelatase subunit ChlI